MSTYLTIINHDPLNYAKKLKLNPDGVSGTALVRLQMAFPLLADVSSEQMQILAAADLQDVTLPHMIGDAAIGDLTGAMTVTTQTLNFKGSGTYKGILLDANWTQNFSPRQGIASDATIDSTLNDKDRAALGFDFPERLTGPIKVDAHYIDKGSAESADIAIDLTQADFKISEVGYDKPPQSPANASLTLLFDSNGLNEIDNIDIKGDRLAITGMADMNPEDNTLRRLALSRFKAGDTDLSGTVDKSPENGTKIVVNGADFDIGPLLHSKTSAPAKKEVDAKRRLEVDFDIKRLETAQTQGLDQVKGDIYLVGKTWQRAEMHAIADGAPFSFSYEPLSPDTGAGHTLAVDSPDAGKTLTSLSLTDSMRGGTLHVEGKQEDAVEGIKKPLTGYAEVQNFNLVNTPFLGRLLNLLSLTGLKETFAGKGITFNIFSVNFEINDQKVVLQDGQLEGSSIGMSVEGTENRDDGMVDLYGTVVPAYSANQALNAVPILGPLLTGGEGQGVFAATYHVSGSFDDPKVSINPLSLFAPGVLRDLFFERKAPVDLPGAPPEDQ